MRSFTYCNWHWSNSQYITGKSILRMNVFAFNNGAVYSWRNICFTKRLFVCQDWKIRLDGLSWGMSPELFGTWKSNRKANALNIRRYINQFIRCRIKTNHIWCTGPTPILSTCQTKIWK